MRSPSMPAEPGLPEVIEPSGAAEPGPPHQGNATMSEPADGPRPEDIKSVDLSPWARLIRRRRADVDASCKDLRLHCRIGLNQRLLTEDEAEGFLARLRALPPRPSRQGPISEIDRYIDDLNRHIGVLDRILASLNCLQTEIRQTLRQRRQARHASTPANAGDVRQRAAGGTCS